MSAVPGPRRRPGLALIAGAWRSMTLCAMAVLALTGAARGDANMPIETTATAEEVQAFFAAERKTVVTFLGFSGSGYEDQAAMLAVAGKILSELDPDTTIVNSGATAMGIGAVYGPAKAAGFTTTGIVSSLAKKDSVPLAPDVDRVFYVEDETWGGFLPGTDSLAPTSQAMVGSSDVLIAIGGGEVARDELIAARRAGKAVRYIPADMNHARAIEKARGRGLPPPTGFEGAAQEAF